MSHVTYQKPAVEPYHVQIKNALIRRKEVERLTSLSRSRIYALIAMGDFPKPIRLGAMSVAWIEAEIQDWISSRISATRQFGGGAK
jgi:prophage regulatory protein